MKSPRWIIVIVALIASAKAQDITGTIQIDRKLTKHSVTVSVPIYQRGTVVKLGNDAQDDDPLAVERYHVVIYLEGPGLASAGPAHVTPPAMQQITRQFAPDLLVVQAGSTVSFPNMDPIFHNVFSLSKPRSFDLGSYDKGDSRNVMFGTPGVVYVYCHLHPNMAASIVVTPNRWYARSDRAGKFWIHDVPPGRYTLVAWHKAAGFIRKPVIVEAGHDSVVNFIVPISERENNLVKDARVSTGESR